jgi:hypothetical protein
MQTLLKVNEQLRDSLGLCFPLRYEAATLLRHMLFRCRPRGRSSRAGSSSTTVLLSSARDIGAPARLPAPDLRLPAFMGEVRSGYSFPDETREGALTGRPLTNGRGADGRGLSLTGKRGIPYSRLHGKRVLVNKHSQGGSNLQKEGGR